MEVKLIMFKADGRRKDILLQNKTVIGRSEGVNLRIPLVNVSRKHCEIAIDGDQIMIKDLGSSNGTYVNSEKVEMSSLKAGDRIIVGPVIFTVQVDGQPEEIQPVRLESKPAKKAPAAAETTTPSDEDDIFAALDLDMDDDDDSGLTNIDPISALEEMDDDDI